MQEKIRAIFRWIRTNLDFAVLILLACFFLYVGGRVYYEFNSPPPSLEEPNPWNPAAQLPNPEYEKIIQLFTTSRSIEEDERFGALLKFNPFDYKIVRDRESLRKEADEKFKQAAKYHNEGDLRAARKMLLEILSGWPTHQASRELLAKIEVQLQPPPTPTPTPAPAPAPGEMPPALLPEER